LNFNSARTITMRVGSRDGDGALFNSLFAVAEWSSAPATITTGSSSPAAPVSTAAPRLLAATGAKVEWLVVTGLLVAIAGSGLLVSSRRKRIW
jgi:LPXTG-motif cell wall-anchored protein